MPRGSSRACWVEFDTAKLQQHYPGRQVFALMPNTPVEIRQGAVVYGVPDEPQPVPVDGDGRVRGARAVSRAWAGS